MTLKRCSDEDIDIFFALLQVLSRGRAEVYISDDHAFDVDCVESYLIDLVGHRCWVVTRATYYA